jgi:acyl dehydratase
VAARLFVTTSEGGCVPLDPSFVGRTYPPTRAYEVGREKIREFAEAIGDTSPAYFDREAAIALGHSDVVAPPTFVNIVTLEAAYQVVYDPALGLDWNRVVHGDQRFVYERPLHAGDVITVTVTVESIRSLAGNDMITLRGDVDTAQGERVVTSYTLLVARGGEDA